MPPSACSPRRFSYVVHHDAGFAPCAAGRYCTLAVCKFRKSGRPNIVEMAEPQVGSWAPAEATRRARVTVGSSTR